MLFGWLWWILTGCQPSPQALLDQAEQAVRVSADSAHVYLWQLEEGNFSWKPVDRARFHLIQLYSFRQSKLEMMSPAVSDSLFALSEKIWKNELDTVRWLELHALRLRYDHYFRQWDSLDVHLQQFYRTFAVRTDTLKPLYYRYKTLLEWGRKSYDAALQNVDSLHAAAFTAAQRRTAEYDRLRIWEEQGQIIKVDSVYQVLLSSSAEDSVTRRRREAWQENWLNWLQHTGRWEQAAAFCRQLRTTRPKKAGRYFYFKGCAHEAVGRLDSARHYFLLASQSGSYGVMDRALESLLLLDSKVGVDLSSLYRKKHQLETDWNSHFQYQQEHTRFKEEQLKKRIVEMKMKRQEYWLYWMVSLVILLVFSVLFLWIYFHEKRRRLLAMEVLKNERLEEEKRRLQDRNLLLERERELSQLREHDLAQQALAANMRDMLFRKLDFYAKLSSGASQETSRDADPKKDAKIDFTVQDWEEVRLAADAVYNGFTQRLRETYPLLTDADITFCALLKLEVSIQDLANLYCVSKAAISKRKLRIKVDKIGIEDRACSLDEFWLLFRVNHSTR